MTPSEKIELLKNAKSIVASAMKKGVAGKVSKPMKGRPGKYHKMFFPEHFISRIAQVGFSEVERLTGVGKAQVLQRSRSQEKILARWMVSLALYKLDSFSLMAIGRCMNRDHASIKYIIKQAPPSPRWDENSIQMLDLVCARVQKEYDSILDYITNK